MVSEALASQVSRSKAAQAPRLPIRTGRSGVVRPQSAEATMHLAAHSAGSVPQMDTFSMVWARPPSSSISSQSFSSPPYPSPLGSSHHRPPFAVSASEPSVTPPIPTVLSLLSPGPSLSGVLQDRAS
eukprot:3082402-Rhodomonas_salina.3